MSLPQSNVNDDGHDNADEDDDDEHDGDDDDDDDNNDGTFIVCSAFSQRNPLLLQRSLTLAHDTRRLGVASPGRSP